MTATKAGKTSSSVVASGIRRGRYLPKWGGCIKAMGRMLTISGHLIKVVLILFAICVFVVLALTEALREILGEV